MGAASHSLQEKSINLRKGHGFSVKPSLSDLKHNIRNIWQKFVSFITISDEPRIWTSIEHDGQTVWHVFNPVDNSVLAMASEQEVRVWIEERYYAS